MGIYNFFESLNDLERIHRAAGKFVYQPHSVAAHSWKVSQYAMFFATIEERAGNKIDWKSVYEKTVMHDWAESRTGDVKSPTKYYTPELRELIAQAEEGMIKTYIKEEIPVEFQDVFSDRLREGKDDTIEGKLLELSDKLDQVFEGFSELQKGNMDPEFISMYQNALSKVLSIDLPASIDYFLHAILPEMIESESSSIVDLREITSEIVLSSQK